MLLEARGVDGPWEAFVEMLMFVSISYSPQIVNNVESGGHRHSSLVLCCTTRVTTVSRPLMSQAPEINVVCRGTV